jgi:hypothetical protein
MIYEIRVEGHLDQHWSEWFCPGGKGASLELAHVASGETVIRGDLADQAALQGVLTKIWNLGLTLNSVVAVRKKPDGDS